MDTRHTHTHTSGFGVMVKSSKFAPANWMINSIPITKNVDIPNISIMHFDLLSGIRAKVYRNHIIFGVRRSLAMEIYVDSADDPLKWWRVDFKW